MVNKTDKSFLFKSSLMAALLAAALGANAAGLGKLTVYSAIGQPLNAEVAISATSDELNTLTARLASHDTFKDAGIDFMPALTGLRFSVFKPADGQPVLRLTTDTPLSEPFLHFLVELNWTAGRMVREYTFLLDPPELLQVKKPAAAVTSAVTTAPSLSATDKPVTSAVAMQQLPVRATITAPATPTAPAPTALATPQAAAPSATKAPVSNTEVQVHVGDTLSKIARENLPDAITLDQMLVALFNKNRSAFDGDNMNRLRAGKILRVPDAAEAARVVPSEARKVVLTQGGDFNAYRRRIAEAAASGAPLANSGAAQEASGKIKPRAEEKAPAAAVDKLEVSNTEAKKSSAKVSAGGDAASRARLEEELVARDKSLREASERIAQLEKNLENLKKLVELKSQAGAELQQKAQEDKPAASTASTATVAPPVPAAKPMAEPVAATVPVPTQPPAEKTATVTKTDSPVAPVAAPEPKAEAAPAPTSPAVQPSPPPPLSEPSFVEENPEIIFGGAGILSLLLGYLGFSAWRKKKQSQPEVASTRDIVNSVSANMAEAVPVVAVTPAIAEDVSILGDFSESGELTSEENVDPVAEADVLMAYGRDEQAEEILLEGLKKDPQRVAIHTKLLELYAARPDVGRFEEIVVDVKRITGASGADWSKTVSLAAGLGIQIGGINTAAAGLEPPVVVDIDLPVIDEVPVADETVVLTSSPLVEQAELQVGSSEEDKAVSAEPDFDLDLGSTSAPAVAVEDEQTAESAKAPVDEVMSLDFDFDLGSPEETTTAATEAVGAAVVEDRPVSEATPVNESALDFDLAMDVPSVEGASKDSSGAVEVTAAEAMEAPAGNEIDFDFDLGTPEPAESSDSTVAAEEISEPASSSAVPMAEVRDLDIDFDLDLGAETPEVITPEVANTVDQESAGQEALPDLAVELDTDTAPDLALDLELPALSAEIGEPETVEPETVEPETVETEESVQDLSPDLEFPDLPDAAADEALAVAEPAVTGQEVPVVPEVPLVPVVPVVPANQDETPAVLVELPDPDLDLDLDAESALSPATVSPVRSGAAPESLDIPDIDLDMDLESDQVVPAALATDDVVEPDDTAMTGSETDDPEVATKLELAQAYEEMGDREGARELLNEVLSEGSVAQKSAARTRLDQLDS